jgi:hypothetical protein
MANHSGFGYKTGFCSFFPESTRESAMGIEHHDLEETNFSSRPPVLLFFIVSVIIPLAIVLLRQSALFLDYAKTLFASGVYRKNSRCPNGDTADGGAWPALRGVRPTFTRIPSLKAVHGLHRGWCFQGPCCSAPEIHRHLLSLAGI